MNMNSELFKFIDNSPTAYHAVENVRRALLDDGYTELFEGDVWNLSDGGRYFTVRSGSSIIAFRYKKDASGFMIVSSHSDFPAFKLKSVPESVGAYTTLNVEKYGGSILYSWLDRPLSLAGRLVVRCEGGVETRLVNIERDLVCIPSVAIHQNREVNDGYKFNPARDIVPLLCSPSSKTSVMDALADAAGVKKDDVINYDVFLYNREKGKTFGLNDEYIISPRLDNLECVYSSLEAFLASRDTSSVPVLAVFDNEEVGSETKQGAASTFMRDVLTRVAGDSMQRMLSNSFMVSADNAHARHQAHPELSDNVSAPVLNGGVVIKWNSNQRYTTDAVSSAVFKTVCERCGAKTQDFYTRADMLSGMTLGSISNTKVSVPSVDIGLAQLAMHSSTETAGAEDLSEMIKALTEFFSTSITVEGAKIKF